MSASFSFLPMVAARGNSVLAAWAAEGSGCCGFVFWRRSDGPLAAQWSEDSLRRRSQQQCSLWVGAEGGDASRFRFATPAAMVEALFRSVWMSTGLGGELDTQSMPRPRLPQIAKTCFDGELFLSGRAQMSVPAGSEGSFVSLFTPLGRLNAGECTRDGPRAARHKRLHVRSDLSFSLSEPWQ